MAIWFPLLCRCYKWRQWTGIEASTTISSTASPVGQTTSSGSTRTRGLCTPRWDTCTLLGLPYHECDHQAIIDRESELAVYGTFIMEITATELDRSGNRGQSVTTEVTIIVTVSNILFLLTTLSFISIIYLTFTSIDIVVMPVITNTHSYCGQSFQ